MTHQRQPPDESSDPDPEQPGLGTLAAATAGWERAERALDETERRYQHLVEHSLGLICTHDLNGTLLSVNPAAVRALAFEPGEGVGRNLRDFLSPDTRHLFDDYLQRIRTTGQDAGLMRVVDHHGHERVWMYRNVLCQESEREPYVLGHAIDVSERVLAEQSLRESRNALARAYAALDDRVRERTAELERANERLQKEILERQEAEARRESALIEQRDTLAFLGAVSERLAPILDFETLFDVIRTLFIPFLSDGSLLHLADDDGMFRFAAASHIDPAREIVLARAAASCPKRPAAESYMGCAVRTEEMQLASAVSRLDWGRLFGRNPQDADEAALGIRRAAVLPLVTERRVLGTLTLVSAAKDTFSSAETALIADCKRRIGLALDRIRLYQEVQQGNRLKDEFLGTLSHELRTPMNAILGWARILRNRPLDSGTAKAVSVIERNAEAQTRLIEDILDVSRIITGKLHLRLDVVDLQLAVREGLDVIRPAAHAKKILIEERIDPDVPPVRGEANRLQQVIWNLLSNAVKFTPAGGAVVVTVRRANHHVNIEVADTGVGIRRDVLPFIFDRFRQADSSTTRSHGGLGLGLAIARYIVELHGGTLRAESPGEGQGATFIVELPMTVEQKKDAAAAPPEPSETVAGWAPVLQGRTVLVVEDNDDARELVSAVLTSSGAIVNAVGTSQEAIDAFLQAAPDAVIADIGLPGEDGYELLRRIRLLDHARARSVPVIALTAYARAEDRERALAAGFAQHVVKPVDPTFLVRIVASLL